MALNFKLVSEADVTQVLNLMQMHYEHDHLRFDPIKAKRAIDELISTSALGRIWLFFGNTSTEAIRYAIEECKKLGIQAIRLEVAKSNDEAARLYKKIGFNDLGRSLLVYWINPKASSEL